jgi:superfamily II DNA or RNA helicase
MEQWFREIVEKGNLPISALGRLGGGYSDDFGPERRILISVLDSARRLLKSKVASAGVGDHLLLIVDESHRSGAKVMAQVFQTRRAYTLGMSATPERDEIEEDDTFATSAKNTTPKPEAKLVEYSESLLAKEVGPIIYELNFADAVRRGILPPFEIRHYGLPLTERERGEYERLSRSIKEVRTELRRKVKGASIATGTAFAAWCRKQAARGQDETARLASVYIQDTARRKALLYHTEGRRVAMRALLAEEFATNPDTRAILFHESIDEVMRLFEGLRMAGIPAVPEHSELPEGMRAKGIALFRGGQARVIVSAKTLIEGFNVPSADIGIIVASSSSVRQRVQSLGRILRRHRTTNGEEKHAVMHVLYMAETVDEVIYEKADWASLTGIGRNRFFLWPLDGSPVEAAGPPRVALPEETAIDLTGIRPGAPYPGRFEGAEFSTDSQGNVRSIDGAVALNPQGVPSLIRKLKGGGRFRVTPKRRIVLVRVPDGEEWETRYVGLLKEPLQFGTGEARPESPSTEALASLAPGDPYPGDVAGPLREYRFKQQAYRGVILLRKGDRALYAATGSSAKDSIKGVDADRTIAAIESVRRRGFQVSRFAITPSRDAVYFDGGQPRYLIRLERGYEFAE